MALDDETIAEIRANEREYLLAALKLNAGILKTVAKGRGLDEETRFRFGEFGVFTLGQALNLAGGVIGAVDES